MPPRRKERRLEPYFTPSGVGKLFYEPADGPQQKKQAETKGREREFQDELSQVSTVIPDDPTWRADTEKVRQRIIQDAPRDAGNLSLSQSLPYDRNTRDRIWDLGVSAGIPGREIHARAYATGHSPARFNTPGHWGAQPSIQDPRAPGEAKHMLRTESARRARVGQEKKVIADNARALSRTTVPVEDVRGLAEVQFGGRPSGSNVAGLYEDPTYGHSGGPKISVFDGHGGKLDTLVHEIGHHVSHKDPNRPVSRMERGHHPDLSAVFPEEEAFADDYAIEHTGENRSSYESHLSDDPNDTFSPRYVASRRHPLRSEEFASGSQAEQPGLFEVEPAISSYDVDVQAYTRDEGREVIGWGPNRQKYAPESIYRHEYTRENQAAGRLFGANYVRVGDEDIVPERHFRGEPTRQTWRR